MAVRLRRLPGDPQRGHGAALNSIELTRSVSAGISTNHSDRTFWPTALFFERPGPNGASGKTKTGGPDARIMPTINR